MGTSLYYDLCFCWFVLEIKIGHVLFQKNTTTNHIVVWTLPNFDYCSWISLCFNITSSGFVCDKKTSATSARMPKRKTFVYVHVYLLCFTITGRPKVVLLNWSKMSYFSCYNGYRWKFWAQTAILLKKKIEQNNAKWDAETKIKIPTTRLH